MQVLEAKEKIIKIIEENEEKIKQQYLTLTEEKNLLQERYTAFKNAAK